MWVVCLFVCIYDCSRLRFISSLLSVCKNDLFLAISSHTDQWKHEEEALRFDLTVSTLRKLDHNDNLLIIRSSQAAWTQKRLFKNKPRPKEFGESFALMTAFQLGTQGRQPSLCQCGSVGKAEQSQTVTSAVTISGSEVLLSLISHPQNPHPFISKGYWLWRWREWLSRICCRFSTLPSSKVRFAALQRMVSHWGIASLVRDKDYGGGTDWQNGKCKHRGPPGFLSLDICLFSPCVFAFACGWWRFISMFFFLVILSFLPANPSALKKPSIPLCNHSCLLCPVGNCCPIHKSW